MSGDLDQYEEITAALDALADETDPEQVATVTRQYVNSDMITSAIARGAGGGGGGSQPTDEVYDFVQSDTVPPAFPIVAYDTGLSTITVSGDATPYFFSLGGGSLNVNAVFFVQSSSANDATCAFGDDPVATYNSGPDTTTIKSDNAAGFTGPADGVVQPVLTYIEDIVIPAGGAVEWVFVEVVTAFEDLASTIGYLWVGDEDDPSAFVNIIDPSNDTILLTEGKYQWPLKTLDGAAIALYPPGSLPVASGIQHYPAGTTVKTIIQALPGQTGGRAKVTVHHHFGEVSAPSPVGS